MNNSAMQQMLKNAEWHLPTSTDQAERTALRQHRNVGDATLAALVLQTSDPAEISALRDHRKAGRLTLEALNEA